MTRRFQTTAILCFAAIYFGAARLGLSLASMNASVSPVWPPTGIALAVLLVWGVRLWPGIFIGAFVANIISQGTLLTALGIATGNTLEALLGAWLVNQFANGRRAFEQARDIFKFIVLAAIVSTTLSATLGTTSLALGGFAQWKNYFPIWTTWWLGDAIGALTITPLILTWCGFSISQWNRQRSIEAIAILASALMVSFIAFGGELTGLSRYLRFLLYPTALWAAYRFGPFGAINAVFAISWVATLGTRRGFGPFASADPNESLLLLQAYLGTFTVTNLILGALVSERQRAENILRESENRFRTLTSHAPVGIFMSKPDGDPIYVNESWCAMTGLVPEEVKGQEWARAIHPEDRARVMAGWSDAVSHKDSSTAEFRFLRPDGVVVWVYGHAVQLWNGNGELAGYIGTVADITELKLAEQLLRESEERFRTMAEAAPVMIWTSGPDKKFDYFNKRWLEFTGRRLEDELGDGWAEGVHPNDLPRCLTLYVRSFDSRREFKMEYRLRRHDGEYRWILDHGIPRFDPTKKFLGYIGSCADITESKQTQTDLEQRVRERTLEWALANATLKGEIAKHQQAALARDQLAAVVEDSQDAILSKSLNGIITSWNRGAQRMLGYAAEEIIGRSVSTIIPNDSGEELEEVLDRIRRDEIVEPFEAMRVRKDRRLIHVSVSLSPIKDQSGNITGVSAIMRDISERKRLESEILQVSEREQRRIAEDLHDGVGQQLGGISCLSNVLKKNLAEQASPEAEAAAKISALLNVAMSQTRSLARGLHPVPPEANGLMSALEELAETISDMFQVNCGFRCEGKVLIEDNATATHLYRIAQEAITNSIKHGRAHRIDISLSTSAEGIILTVSDDGTGFNPSQRTRQGLGLRIMNHRAGMINGTLVVQKKAGSGTQVACTVQRRNGATS